MMRGLIVALLLMAAPIPAPAQEVEEEPTVFPDGPARDDVFYFCTGCHSSRLIRNQAMSRERWDATLTWMTERHGMSELEGAERERFLSYLSKAFGPDGGEGRAAPFSMLPPRKNPFAP